MSNFARSVSYSPSRGHAQPPVLQDLASTSKTHYHLDGPTRAGAGSRPIRAVAGSRNEAAERDADLPCDTHVLSPDLTSAAAAIPVLPNSPDTTTQEESPESRHFATHASTLPSSFSPIIEPPPHVPSPAAASSPALSELTALDEDVDNWAPAMEEDPSAGLFSEDEESEQQRSLSPARSLTLADATIESSCTIDASVGFAEPSDCGSEDSDILIARKRRARSALATRKPLKKICRRVVTSDSESDEESAGPDSAPASAINYVSHRSGSTDSSSRVARPKPVVEVPQFFGTPHAPPAEEPSTSHRSSFKHSARRVFGPMSVQRNAYDMAPGDKGARDEAPYVAKGRVDCSEEALKQAQERVASLRPRTGPAVWDQPDLPDWLKNVEEFTDKRPPSHPSSSTRAHHVRKRNDARKGEFSEATSPNAVATSSHDYRTSVGSSSSAVEANGQLGQHPDPVPRNESFPEPFGVHAAAATVGDHTDVPPIFEEDIESEDPGAPSGESAYSSLSSLY
jgi:hypothetical protein